MLYGTSVVLEVWNIKSRYLEIIYNPIKLLNAVRAANMSQSAHFAVVAAFLSSGLQYYWRVQIQ
jgi:hypothetical protein